MSVSDPSPHDFGGSDIQQPPSASSQVWPATPPPGYQPAALPSALPVYDPEAPYGRDPFGRPYSDKSKVVAGLLQLFLGTFGIGRFYLGDTGLALGQLFTCGGLGIWALIDGIVLLAGSPVDRYGRPLQG